MRVDYDAYMTSAKWFERRDAFFSKYRARCGCGSRFNLELHHKTYVNLGHERDEDLVPVCETCHKRVHSQAKDIQGQKKLPYWEALAEASKYLEAELGPSLEPTPFSLPVFSFARCSSHPQEGKCGYCDAVEGVTGRRPELLNPPPQKTWTDEDIVDLSPLDPGRHQCERVA